MTFKGPLRSGFASFLLLSFVLCPLDTAVTQGQGYSGWHMGPAMMDGWGTGWLGMIVMMAFWILMILGLIFVIRWLI
jgi:hypothetical protein